MTDKLDINVPFHGFYESIHDGQIDDAISQHFDYDGDGEPDFDLLDREIDFSDIYFDMDFTPVQNRYAKEYVDFINGEADLVSLEFAELTSPKEYNFETDRIFATISKEDVLKMYGAVDKGALDDVIKGRFTSYDGFISFYPNSLDVWLKDKPDVLTWDANELGTLLMAYIDQECCHDHNDLNYDALDDIRVNEWICEYLPAKWQEIGDEIYRAVEAKERQMSLKLV